MLGQPGETKKQTASKESANVPGLNSGLLFTPKGPLILATGEWTVVTRFQTVELRHQSRRIHGFIDQIGQAVNSFPEFKEKQDEANPEN